MLTLPSTPPDPSSTALPETPSKHGTSDRELSFCLIVNISKYRPIFVIFLLLFSFKVVGKLSGGQQSQIMVLAVDDTDTASGDICVVTGSKDHYIKVQIHTNHGIELIFKGRNRFSGV